MAHRARKCNPRGRPRICREHLLQVDDKLHREHRRHRPRSPAKGILDAAGLPVHRRNRGQRYRPDGNAACSALGGAWWSSETRPSCDLVLRFWQCRAKANPDRSTNNRRASRRNHRADQVGGCNDPIRMTRHHQRSRSARCVLLGNHNSFLELIMGCNADDATWHGTDHIAHQAGRTATTVSSAVTGRGSPSR